MAEARSERRSPVSASATRSDLIHETRPQPDKSDPLSRAFGTRCHTRPSNIRPISAQERGQIVFAEMAGVARRLERVSSDQKPGRAVNSPRTKPNETACSAPLLQTRCEAPPIFC